MPGRLATQVLLGCTIFPLSRIPRTRRSIYLLFGRWQRVLPCGRRRVCRRRRRRGCGVFCFFGNSIGLVLDRGFPASRPLALETRYYPQPLDRLSSDITLAPFRPRDIAQSARQNSNTGRTKHLLTNSAGPLGASSTSSSDSTSRQAVRNIQQARLWIWKKVRPGLR
ncbi:hypothetical protein KC323_g267 [Hortaea werneckii]|nr:hypothetical protein KC323_g267 [Hortaea werneckii]